LLKNHYLQTKSERRHRCVFHLCGGEWEEESREEEALDSGKRKRWEDIVDEFPLLEQLSTANEDKFPLLIQSDATAEELCAAAEVKE
nr:hypothetical protein [Tanacetum cinerariifolium]